MATSPRPGVFTTFDGLRGVAALLVVSRHVGPYFGPLSFPESYLAVDLFFLLSGFVIANAYDARLAKGGFMTDFFKIRMIRLYPLYAAGLAVAVALRLYMHGEPGDPWRLGPLLETALLALVLLPGPRGDPTGGYSLNSPSWTLLPEIVINMAYAMLFRWMTTRVLIALIFVGSLGMVVAELRGHKEAVQAVAFAGESWLVSAGTDGVHVWGQAPSPPPPPQTADSVLPLW